MFVGYGSLAAVGLRRRYENVDSGMTVDDLFFVFVVPCLNEELVIDASINRLLAIPGKNMAILVIDDGSDDATAEIVSRNAERDSRVRLLRRRAPNARKGKGAALNAAYEYLQSSNLATAAGYDSDHVVVVVVDADGRLEPDAPVTVAPLFADPRLAAVQIGVRMYNRDAGWLARMQDMEFLVFTEIYQRARRQHGNAGLGGNGQFVRLSALESLGDEPWTDYLTEDLDMGLRLQALGWRTGFTPATFVSQEGLTTLRPLMRQRTRWFQGHLQCWSRIVDVLKCRDISMGRAVDLMIYLVTPVTVLLITLSLVAYLPGQVAVMITRGDIAFGSLVATHGLLLWWYLFAFSLTPLVGIVYWRAANRRVRDVSLFQALVCVFLFSLYAYVWLPVGWRAAWRLIRRKRGWAKTLRLAVQPPLEPSALASESPLATHS